MRIVLLLLVMVLMTGGYLLSRKNSAIPDPMQASTSAKAAPSLSNSKIDFDSQIKPIFQARCQPCHFTGGVMYDRLPFDRPETIRKLGTKVFSRIKDEKQQRLIREFLDQP